MNLGQFAKQFGESGESVFWYLGKDQALFKLNLEMAKSGKFKRNAEMYKCGVFSRFEMQGPSHINKRYWNNLALSCLDLVDVGNNSYGKPGALNPDFHVREHFKVIPFKSCTGLEAFKSLSMDKTCGNRNKIISNSNDTHRELSQENSLTAFF